MLSNLMQTQLVAIADIHPYRNHARHHSNAQRAKLKRLVIRFGQVVPVIVDPAHTIIDGHLFWETMRELGHKTIAVVRVEGQSDPELRALRLARNRLPQDAHSMTAGQLRRGWPARQEAIACLHSPERLATRFPWLPALQG